MKAQDDTMKKLAILIVGLLVMHMLVGTLVTSAAPGVPCLGSTCGGGGYLRNPGPTYYPYGGLYQGMSQSPPLYYFYNYCEYPAYQPYVPAFYWWEYPYYPGCGTGMGCCVR
jgi:hypothetical protein